MKKILVFGPSRTVETLTVPTLLTATEGVSYETTLGGQGETVAVALARLGARSVFSGRVGDDSGGKRLVRLLDVAGVDLSCFRVDRTAQTGHVVCETDGRERRTLLFPGADAALTEDDVRAAFLTAPEAVCVAGALSPILLSLIAALAEERAIPVFMLYTGAVPAAPLPRLHVFVTDEQTAAAISGVVPSGADNALKAVIAMQRSVQADYYIIRQGERGAFLYDGTYCHLVSSFVLPKNDDRGADEVFFAATVCEYLTAGGELQLALRYAAAAAALAASRRGIAEAAPTADEVLAFLERN